ncbi:MAG: sce7726 family protein [Clostridiales bacterium]|nr:sce7726 family protein [Clostridiales bacterium]
MLHDKDIREPLFDFLEESFGKIRIFEEKRMGGSRADVVMVTPESVIGIEIKSDADTYARLRTQVEDYDKYFDRNYVVVGTSHAFHIEEHVPEYWGIITVERESVTVDSDRDGSIGNTDGKTRLQEAGILLEQNIGAPDFYVLRPAAANPNMHRKQKLSLLWRPELVHIQELNDMPKYAGKSKEFVIDKILQRVPEETLAPQISEELFERDYSTILETINAYRQQHGQKKRRKRKRRKYKPI